MFFEQNVYSFLPTRFTSMPISLSRRIRLFTSRISGMFFMRTSSFVRSVAHITSRASFLAPCGVMVPLSICPPSIINDSIFGIVYGG